MLFVLGRWPLCDSGLELLVSNAQDPNATLLYDGKSSRRPKPYRVTFTSGHNRVQVLLQVEEEVMNDTSKACATHESLCLTVHLIWADLPSFRICCCCCSNCPLLSANPR
jgi:hypothetical protein